MKKYIAIVLVLLVLSGSLALVAFADGFSYGDANKDGKVNIKDATYVQRYVAMLIELDEESLRLADVDVNGKVNVKDATMIQKFLAMLIDGFPASDKPAETLTTEGETSPDEGVTDSAKVTTAPFDDITEPDEVATSPTQNATDPAEKATVPIQTVKPTVPSTPAQTVPQATDPKETQPPAKPTVTEPVKPTKPSVDKDGYYDQIIRP